VSSIESVWEFRDRQLYPELFGTVGRGGFSIPEDTFRRLTAGEIDPRWLQLGVFEYAPSATRKSWLYVSSGGSTPWDADPAQYDPEAYSWLGVEYVLETPMQADWPIRVLQWLLANHVLAALGRNGEVQPDYGQRIALGGPIDGARSVLRHLALCLPMHYPSQARLDSGKFDFLHALGISDDESARGEAVGTPRLVQLLAAKGAAPVTDPGRQSVLRARPGAAMTGK
jgi:hypothetical protein